MRFLKQLKHKATTNTYSPGHATQREGACQKYKILGTIQLYQIKISCSGAQESVLTSSLGDFIFISLQALLLPPKSVLFQGCAWEDTTGHPVGSRWLSYIINKQMSQNETTPWHVLGRGRNILESSSITISGDPQPSFELRGTYSLVCDVPARTTLCSPPPPSEDTEMRRLAVASQGLQLLKLWKGVTWACPAWKARPFPCRRILCQPRICATHLYSAATGAEKGS